MDGMKSEWADLKGNAVVSCGHRTGWGNPMLYSSRAMVDLLRSTLGELEKETQDLDPNDPILLEFKASILRSIAELELKEPRAA
jgi:hypothetical protein